MDQESSVPDKVFYKIGEVAEMTGVEPYVLRYWEKEFHLSLTKSKKNQRLFQKKDIEQIQKIKALLRNERFTIAGAKKRLKGKNSDSKDFQLSLNYSKEEIQKTNSLAHQKWIQELQSEVIGVLKFLDQPQNLDEK